jgi:hypothetical protein
VLLAPGVQELDVDVRLSDRLHINARTSARGYVRQVTGFALVSEAFNFHAHLPHCFSTVIPYKDANPTPLAYQHPGHIKKEYSNGN